MKSIFLIRLPNRYRRLNVSVINARFERIVILVLHIKIRTITYFKGIFGA